MPNPTHDAVCKRCGRDMELMKGRTYGLWALAHIDLKHPQHSFIPYGWHATPELALLSNKPQQHLEYRE